MNKKRSSSLMIAKTVIIMLLQEYLNFVGTALAFSSFLNWGLTFTSPKYLTLWQYVLVFSPTIVYLVIYIGMFTNSTSSPNGLFLKTVNRYFVLINFAFMYLGVINLEQGSTMLIRTTLLVISLVVLATRVYVTNILSPAKTSK